MGQSLTHIWDMAAKFGVKPKAVLSKILKLKITKHYVLSTSYWSNESTSRFESNATETYSILNNCLFVFVQLQNLLSKNFENYLSLASEQHQYLTRETRLNISTIKAKKYRSHSIALMQYKLVLNLTSTVLNSSDQSWKT